MTTPPKSINLISGGLLAVLILTPYLFAIVTGQPDPAVTGLAQLHSAAESVFCQDGFTFFTGLWVFEISLILIATLMVQWKGDRFGLLGLALKQEGWYLVCTLAFIATPFILAWGTDSSACTRGKAFFWESIFIDIFILAILAISYNLLFGFSGIVSFGHAAFFGLGAYSVGLFMQHLQWPWWLAIVAALLIGVAVAVVKGVVGLRIKGLYFALFTLAFAQVFYLLAGNRILADLTGAEDGFTFDVPDWLNITRNRLFFYYLVLIIFVVAFMLVRRLMHSPTGRVLVALRENESRAQMLGYNVFYFKLIAIVLAGVLATGAGVLRGLSLKGASPEVLSLTYTFDPLLMTIIGGQGTFVGPVVGAFGIHLTEEALRDTIINWGGLEINLGERWALILGVLFVLSVMVFPYGIVGSLTAWWHKRKTRSA